MMEITQSGSMAIKAVLLLLLLLLLPVAGSASEPPDPATWYKGQYVPLWQNVSQDSVAEVAKFYHPQIHEHLGSGGIVRHLSKEWMKQLIEGWLAEGWTGSEVPNIEVNRINESTATFTTRWLDHYPESEDEYSCGWYMADLIEGEWQFTHYAAMDCDQRDW